MDRDQKAKRDAGKLRMELIPPTVFVSLGRVLTHGAQKYEDESWKDVEPERYVGALLRHLTAHLAGESIDSESGLTHMEHVLCNAAFLNHMNEGAKEARICVGTMR